MIRTIKIRKDIGAETAAVLALALTTLALLAMLAGALHAGAEEADIWIEKERVKPFLLSYQNLTDSGLVPLTEIKVVDRDGPSIWIEGRWYVWHNYLCQSWAGGRAYAQDFPRVKVELKEIGPAYIYLSGADYPQQGIFYPILALGHEGSSKILYVSFRVTPNVFEPKNVTYALEVALYNVETGKLEWLKIIQDLNDTVLPIEIDLTPQFYTMSVADNLTTVVFGWLAYIKYVEGPTEVTKYVQIAYETYTVPAENLSMSAVREYVEDLRGWYVWVGSGLIYYLGERAVQHCMFNPDGWELDARSDVRYWVLISWPLIENWRTTPLRIWNAYVSGELPEYRPGISEVREIRWEELYAAIIPPLAGLGFALAAKNVLKGELGAPGALGSGLALTLLLGWLYGWGPLELTIAVIFYGVAIWLNT